jgi:hypothetical protein
MIACTRTNVVCFGASTGSVTAGTVNNNIGTVSYVWKNAGNTTVGTTSSVPNLPVGTYTCTVTDNCPASLTCSVTITGPAAALALGTCSKTDVTCTSAGSVAAGTVTNNVGTVNYTWKNAGNTTVGTTANVGGLGAGTYTLTVTDNCSTATCNVTVAAAPSLSAPTVCVVQPSLCGSAGSVTVTSPAKGTGVQFSIDNGATWQDDNVFPNLGAGSVTGIKVKVGDCTSPAANCAASSCQQLRTISTNTENPENNIRPPSEQNTEVNVRPQNYVNTNNNVKPQSNVELPVSKIGIRAYPNPYNDHVTFVIVSPKAGYGSLEVVNMLGQKIKTVYQGHIISGSQSFEMAVPVSQRTSLFYVFKMGDEQLNGKLLQLSQK